jgi:molybdate transport system ATP-binding protein
MFLEVQNLSVDLGEFYLENVNLSLDKNSYMVIIGPTGSGKSVLLETIAGFYGAEKGRIFLEEKEITKLNPEDRGISIVYQDYVLFPHMTVFENIAYGLKKKTNDKEIIKSKVLKMAKLLKIEHLLHRNPTTLSGGEKQRTAIARSLIVEPKILLMDEPFSAVDVSTHAYLTKLIKNAIADYETTCIHVTHNFNDVWNLAEKVAVMKDGKILQQGDLKEVFSKPSHNFVADFVGVHNIFKGEIVEKKGSLTKIKLNPDLTVYSTDKSSDSKNVLVAIRPENIIFSNEAFVSSVQNQIIGTVNEIVKVGPIIWIEVKIGEINFQGILTLSSCEKLGIKKGKEIYLSFKSVNVKIINENEFTTS